MVAGEGICTYHRPIYPKVDLLLRVNEEDLMSQNVTPLRNYCKQLVVNNFPANLKRVLKSTGLIDL